MSALLMLTFRGIVNADPTLGDRVGNDMCHVPVDCKGFAILPSDVVDKMEDLGKIVSAPLGVVGGKLFLTTPSIPKNALLFV